MTVLLELTQVHTYYGHIHALKGLNLRVDQGEIVTLVGANGAGKTTTLKTISGITHPKRGRVKFNARDITDMPPHLIAKQGIAHVPEGRRIFPLLSVRENLEVGSWSVKGGSGVISDRMNQMFDMFPRLKERINQKGGTLSGGEQQMLAMARALMMAPSVLLLDEPSMGLAPVLVEGIFDIVKRINEAGNTVLLVEQNALMALEVAHRGYVLQTGEIVLEDTGSALLKNELVRKAYLGEM
ncbi:MAG: ABC transporter ATP-binding protein [Anaerolineae bacterium]|nr:ABC transporter ATP-binding protein [Anaerolineae bacterium]